MKLQIAFVLLLATILDSANGDLLNKVFDIGSKIKQGTLLQSDLYALINGYQKTIKGLHNAFNSENGLEAKKELAEIFSRLSVTIKNDPYLANVTQSKALKELTKNLLKIDSDLDHTSGTLVLASAQDDTPSMMGDELLVAIEGVLVALLGPLGEGLYQLVSGLLDLLAQVVNGVTELLGGEPAPIS